MKRLWIVCMAVVMLVLTACAPIAQPDTTTAPPETTAAPVETTALEQETTLSEEDPLVAEFRELLTFTADSDWWYNYALKSYYDEPAGIDIFQLVYSAPWETELTQEEKDFLISKNLEIEIFNVNKYPVEKIDEVLQKYFGITFEEAQGIGLDKMVYNPDTNSYYHLHGDFEAGYPTVSDVAAQEDGSYIVYYESVDGSCAVTLKKAENGEYLILSNIVLE